MGLTRVTAAHTVVDGGQPYDPDPASPLWRAAQVFRLLSYLYALGFHVAITDDLRAPGLGWALFGVLTVWTALCAVAYLKGFGRNARWVAAEFVVVVGLVLSTLLVATPQWMHENQSWPTTLWATNATISAAILAGPTVGVIGAVVVLAASTTVKRSISVDLGQNAAAVMEIVVALAVGMAAVNARRVHQQIQRAARLAATVEERERLSRQVHDGVIQVLALVARRGREIGGPTAELAELASVQERALRHLVSTSDIDVAASSGGLVDVGELLRRHEAAKISVSLPGEQVLLAEETASELDAAVVNALDNIRHHAGPGAKAYVLVEDFGESVVVSIRDDGAGIAVGRLAQAKEQGHVGISKAIVGRMEWLGGSAQVHSAPGEGTEWELVVPRRKRS